MNTEPTLPDSVIKAFDLMWGNFPEPASLVHKSRTVMAINKAYKALGILQPGMSCAKLGDPSMHKGCLANKAVSSGEAAYTYNDANGKEVIGFWLPLDEYPEFFVHFGVGHTINYKETAPRKG